jgi:hypothetical protein
MLRPRRILCRIALVLAALAILLGVPRAAHPVARQDPARQPVAAITLAARSPAATSGLCSVPGIGDIGNLLQLCSQGGITGDLNNICQPSLPSPELASSGIDSLVKPAAAPGPRNGTLYDNYGVAGDYWAATNLQCSDMTSLIGNNVASMVFDIAKSIDRVIISVYQSAASEGILSWLTAVVDKLISSLGNAIYFPYLAIVVILGAIWLAWQGLIRKRGTRTIEGTIWMVVACAAAIWLIGRPADFTGLGRSVSDGISQTLNVAFSKLPSPGQSSCLPVQRNDPQVQPVTYNYSSGNGTVDQNANALWTVLVCKPWLDGEFGTTNFATSAGGQQTPVNTYARQLLWAQAIAINEKPSAALIQAKQSTYSGIANSIQQGNPGLYPLFQGKQWTTRLEIALAALFAATVAGILVALIAVTLILLKLGFLLLLVVGPFFLLIGTHPGFGRVIALRWFEMLVGVLLKQAAVALVLSVLLYAYSLIMGTTDAVLPWALKILMIALVTVAVFIYRRPFQHLFSAVGYGMIGSSERAEVSLSRAGTTARGNTMGAATAAVPGFAAYRAARWARRNPAHAATLSAVSGAVAGSSPGVAAGAAGAQGVDGDLQDGRLVDDGSGVPTMAALPDGSHAGGRRGLSARARAKAASASENAGRTPPPLHLRSRQPAGSAGPAVPGAGGVAGGAVAAGQAAGAGQLTAAGPRAAQSSLGSPSAAPSSRTPASPAQPGQPRLAAPGLPNSAQPRNAGPTSPWPGVSGRQSLGGSRPAQPAAGPPAAVPPARSATPPAAAPSPRPVALPPASVPQGRPAAGPPARTPSPPAARPSSPPARTTSPPPARPAGPPAAAVPPAARSASPQPSRAASPWPARPASPAPARPASPPPAPAAPPPARAAAPPAAGPAPRPAAWPGRTASGRQPAAAPPARQGGPAGPPASTRPGSQAAPAAVPLAGEREADQSESPVPFWLRPLRRRK